MLNGIRARSLNASQVRSLAVVLRLVEEAVDQIEAALGGGEEAHILHRRINPHTEAEQREIRETIAEIREALRRCRDRWGLPVEVRRLDAEIAAHVSRLWSDLEECRPEKMHRYGDVPETLRADLEQDVEALSRLVVRLGDVRREKE